VRVGEGGCVRRDPDGQKPRAHRGHVGLAHLAVQPHVAPHGAAWAPPHLDVLLTLVHNRVRDDAAMSNTSCCSVVDVDPATTEGGSCFSATAVRLADIRETETASGAQLEAADDAEVRRRCSV
jgi:hypothetical protein